MPERIQRKRGPRGWRMPEGAVYVGRPMSGDMGFQVRSGCPQPVRVIVEHPDCSIASTTKGAAEQARCMGVVPNQTVNGATDLTMVEKHNLSALPVSLLVQLGSVVSVSPATPRAALPSAPEFYRAALGTECSPGLLFDASKAVSELWCLAPRCYLATTKKAVIAANTKTAGAHRFTTSRIRTYPTVYRRRWRTSHVSNIAASPCKRACHADVLLELANR